MTTTPRRSSVRAEQDRQTGSVRRPVGGGRDVALVAVFAALVCALALAPVVPVGPLAVPITLGSLGIVLCGAVLGPWRGALAVLLYLVVGFAGLPVFAGGAAGLGVLAGPTAGYLLAFPPAALVVGAVTRAGVRRGRGGTVPGLVLGCVLGGLGVITAGGVVGFVLNAGFTLQHAAAVAAVYLPGDVVKVVVAVLVTAPVHRAFPRLLGR